MASGSSDHPELDPSSENPRDHQQPASPAYVWLLHHWYPPLRPPGNSGQSTTFPSLDNRWTPQPIHNTMNPLAASFTPFTTPELSFATPSIPTPRYDDGSDGEKQTASVVGHRAAKCRKSASGPLTAHSGCHVSQDHAASECPDDQPARPTANEAMGRNPIFRLKVDHPEPTSQTADKFLKRSAVDTEHLRQDKGDPTSTSGGVKGLEHLRPVMHRPDPRPDHQMPATTHAQAGPLKPTTHQLMAPSHIVMEGMPGRQAMPVPAQTGNANHPFSMVPPQHYGNMVFPPFDPARPYFHPPPMMPYLPPPGPYFHPPFVVPYHAVQRPVHQGFQGHYGQQTTSNSGSRPPSRRMNRQNTAVCEHERPYLDDGRMARHQSRPPLGTPRDQFTTPVPHVEKRAPGEAPSSGPHIEFRVETPQSKDALVRPTTDRVRERIAGGLGGSNPQGRFNLRLANIECAEQLSELDDAETDTRNDRRTRRGRRGRASPNSSAHSFLDEHDDFANSNEHCTEADGGKEASGPASHLQIPPLNAPKGPATNRRVSNIPKTSNRTAIVYQPSESAAWSQSKRWTSLETKERMAFQKMMLNLHFMGADKSPFVPQNPAELTAFRVEIAEARRQKLSREVNRLLAKNKQNRGLKRQEADKSHRQITLFNGRELRDKLSPIFAAKNCFNKEQPEEKEHRVDWPSLAELKEEGDKRAAKYGRYFPLPRMNIVAARILEKEREKAYNADGSIF